MGACLGSCLSGCVRSATQAHDRYMDWKWNSRPDEYHQASPVYMNIGDTTSAIPKDRYRHIHAAVVDRNLVEIRRIICAGSGACNTVENGETALHAACKLGYVDVVAELLNGGCVPDICTDIGTPIHSALQAVKSGYLKSDRASSVVERLVQRGCPLDAVDGKRRTALFCAVENSNVTHSKLLLKLGANANIKESNAFSPLYMAVLKGDMQMVHHLISSESSFQKFNVDLNAEDTAGRTPLMGALITIMNTLRYEALQNSTYHSRIKLENNSSLQLNRNHMIAIVELLLWKGAAVNFQDHINRTPLMLAFAVVELSIFKYEYAGDVATDTSQLDETATAPIYAILVSLLIMHGAIAMEQWKDYSKRPKWLQKLYSMSSSSGLKTIRETQPHRLLDTSRHAIRIHLASLGKLDELHTLPLPESVKQFLAFSLY